MAIEYKSIIIIERLSIDYRLNKKMMLLMPKISKRAETFRNLNILSIP